MRLTNRERAKTDEIFRQVCQDAGVYPSRTAFRKWKWRRGAAYQYQQRIDKDRANTVKR